MKLISATIECPYCPRKFHQIDGTEERALQVVRDALDSHLVDEHSSITCPKCGMTSYHPEDIRQGFCGNCHDWTTPR